jgi:DNA-binding NarL/FixJ family response regulator
MEEFVKFCDAGEISYNEKNNEVIITIKNLKLKFRKENNTYVHINYTEQELNEIINKCNFNKDNGEIEVLKMYNDGKSNLAMSLALNMSTATISRRVKKIKEKIKMIKK